MPLFSRQHFQAWQFERWNGGTVERGMAQQETKKHYGNGSGKTTAYTVEVRTTSREPKVHDVSGFIITGEWQRAPYRLLKCDREDHNHWQSGRIGEIPVWNYCHEADNLNLLSFDAAYALAILFEAQQWNGGCIEARIVSIQVSYSYSTEEQSVGEPISLWNIHKAMKFESRDAAFADADKKGSGE